MKYAENRENPESSNEELFLEMLSSASGWVNVESLSFNYHVTKPAESVAELKRYTDKHDESIEELKPYASFIFGPRYDQDGGVRPS